MRKILTLRPLNQKKQVDVEDNATNAADANPTADVEASTTAESINSPIRNKRQVE